MSHVFNLNDLHELLTGEKHIRIQTAYCYTKSNKGTKLVTEWPFTFHGIVQHQAPTSSCSIVCASGSITWSPKLPPRDPSMLQGPALIAAAE